MRKIIDARANGFMELRGVKRFQAQPHTTKEFQTHSEWSSLIAPPAMSSGLSCQIIQDEPLRRTTYYCSTLDHLLTQQQATQIYLNVVQGTRAAVPDWQLRRIQLVTAGVPTGEKMLFIPRGETHTAIQIFLAKQNGNSSTKSWYVDLYVYADPPK